MFDFAAFSDWASHALRWLHVIAGITWIGSSFYFLAVDLRLARETAKSDSEEEWQIYGGSFYVVRRYPRSPPDMPNPLTWFRWESYATWASGFILLATVYYLNANLYLIDPGIADLAPWQAIGVSIASIIVGWVIYDRICKSWIGNNTLRLLFGLTAFLVTVAWFYSSVFSGRAAFLHLGALAATLMTANIAHIIVPNQRKIIAELGAGRLPDAALATAARQRSIHNSYLTMPVVFMMLSPHVPFAFATQFNWAIACLVFLTGMCFRHSLNGLYARSNGTYWSWGATGFLFLVAVWLSSLGSQTARSEDTALSTNQQRHSSAPTLAQIHDIIQDHCVMCHSANPVHETFRFAPSGVVLETEAQVAAYAREIYVHAGRTNAMPPSGISFMESSERDAIIRWYEAAARH